jgi:hypothetical protein
LATSRAVRLKVYGLILNIGRQSTASVPGGSLILHLGVLRVSVFRHIEIIAENSYAQQCNYGHFVVVVTKHEQTWCVSVKFFNG